MPKSLRIYVAGLVTAGALALAITSFVIPVDSHIRLGVLGSEGLDVLAGLAFWTGLTLLASAMPVQMPRGFLVATSIAPIVAAMSVGRPHRGRVGRAHRDDRIPRTLRSSQMVWHAGQPCGTRDPCDRRWARPSDRSVRPDAGRVQYPVLDFAATLLGALLFSVLNVSFTAGVVALRNEPVCRRVVSEDLPVFVGDVRRVGSVGLGHDGRSTGSQGSAGGRRSSSPCPSTSCEARSSRSSRCVTCSRRRSGRLRRRSMPGDPYHGTPQRERPDHLRRHRARDATVEGSRDRGPRVGWAPARRRQDRQYRTPSCSSRTS